MKLGFLHEIYFDAIFFIYSAFVFDLSRAAWVMDKFTCIMLLSIHYLSLVVEMTKLSTSMFLLLFFYVQFLPKSFASNYMESVISIFPFSTGVVLGA